MRTVEEDLELLKGLGSDDFDNVCRRLFGWEVLNTLLEQHVEYLVLRIVLAVRN